MNGMMGMAQMLLSSEISEEERQHYAKIILSSGKSLLTILNDILDMSKIDTGKISIQINILEPEQLLDKLRQMLSNLISNAIKFTDRGMISVEGYEIYRENDNAMLEFVVTDTGIGIDIDTQMYLFQPFVQADSTIDRKYGLSSVWQI